MTVAIFVCAVAEGGVFTVTNVNDSGAGSLRQAMTDALTNSGNTINFYLTGTPPFTINLASALPVVGNPLTIDGRTQPGYSNAPLVELNGTNADSGVVGLQLNAGYSSVFALAINRFASNGITVSGPSNVIQGNFIGTDPTGNLARGNKSYGICVKSAGNQIGGIYATNGNVICGNDTGIYLLNASGNVIQGNWIGLGFNGTNALGNANNGILVNGGNGNQIGGPNAGARNVISGNGQSGLYLNTASATRNLIQGNYLGTDVSGSLGITNLGDGITLNGAPGNTIGPSNVISGNALSGIQMMGATAKTNVVIGNFIGTDASGKIALGNRYDGLYLTNAPANQIGGTTVGTGNLISGNLQNGIVFIGGGNSNAVQGNLIGLANGGTNALPNRWDGILISGGSGNVIGALKGGGGNFISGNGTNGVFIMLTNDCFNLIAGNYIGTDVTGEKAVPNSLVGVLIQGCTNTVGGNNVISGNGQQGVVLSGVNGSAAGNVVMENYIGLDANGANGLGNGNAGVGISSAAGNVIGPFNVISGNGYVGIYVIGPGAGGNVISGNYVGTDASGATTVPNNASGIFVQATTSGTIGGTNAGDGNLISGNSSYGVLLTNSTGFFVAGNYVGLDVNGTTAIKNSGSGIYIANASLANWIGGSTTTARNVISGNNNSSGSCGIWVIGSAAQVIQGNYVGTDASGTYAVGNSGMGIYLQNSTNNFIGGINAGNVIAGNGTAANNNYEVRLDYSPQNNIQGNYVGLNAAGMTGLGPITADGIYLSYSSGNVIGGSLSGADNVVSSNHAGMFFDHASQNIISGNIIGLASDGSNPLGNNYHGVEFYTGSTNNFLGGVNPGTGNRIAFAKTGYAGVRVRTNAFNNLISGNCIYSNGTLGIDLGNVGTNPIIHLQAGGAGNDANRLQNYPILSNAVSGTATLIRGSFDGALGKTYALEFFASPVGNTNGYGEGRTFLGQTNLVLGGVSPTNFSFVLPATVPAGWVVTATATDATNNTSEFSNWVTTSPVPQLQTRTNSSAHQFTLSWTNTGGSFSLLQSSNLNPPQWTPTGVTSPTNGIYSVPVSATNPANFYRLLAQ